MFKKMVVQKRRELIKDYEKQEKRLKELKSQGQSKKKAEAKTKDALTRKQQKNQVFHSIRARQLKHFVLFLKTGHIW